jgi:hypothetical protein
MSDEPKKEVPEAVRKVVEAMTSQAVARCDRLGIPLENFYRAMLEEQSLNPKATVVELFEQTFRRLEGALN